MPEFYQNSALRRECQMVITVLAHFGLLERRATRKAGQIAGLNVLDILAEPMAAALSYLALGEDAGTRTILIYHLGRQTFDTAVIHVDRDDVHMICADSDQHLGGADWDKVISDFLLRGFSEENPQLDPGFFSITSRRIRPVYARFADSYSMMAASLGLMRKIFCLGKIGTVKFARQSGKRLVLVCLSRASINKIGYLQKEIRTVLDAADEQPEGTIFVSRPGWNHAKSPSVLVDINGWISSRVQDFLDCYEQCGIKGLVSHCC